MTEFPFDFYTNPVPIKFIWNIPKQKTTLNWKVLDIYSKVFSWNFAYKCKLVIYDRDLCPYVDYDMF